MSLERPQPSGRGSAPEQGVDGFLLPPPFRGRSIPYKCRCCPLGVPPTEFNPLPSELCLQRPSIVGGRSGKGFLKLMWLETEAGLEAAVMAPGPVSLPSLNCQPLGFSAEGWQAEGTSTVLPPRGPRRKGALEHSLVCLLRNLITFSTSLLFFYPSDRSLTGFFVFLFFHGFIHYSQSTYHTPVLLRSSQSE